MKLNEHYKVFYRNKETINKYKVIKFVLNKRFSDEEIKNNLFLNSLLLFYKSRCRRAISINVDEFDKIYLGKDMRLFNNLITNNNLDDAYINILNEMQNGFDEIVIEDKKQYDAVVNLTKFLCIYPDVNIIVRGDIK